MDCCGGTLGSLIQNSSGTQYLLSSNHVLARSDQASVGETIVQPGLIDDNCTPNGQTGAANYAGRHADRLACRSSSSSTNADAAIAAVNSGAVNTSGEHSGTGCAAGQRHAGRRASGHLFDGRQGREPHRSI